MSAEEPRQSPDAGAPRVGLRRHLEGWPLAVVALLFPLCALWLALPRPVAPRRLPLPEVDRAVVARLQVVDAQRADTAERVGLPFATRQVGELVRRFGHTRSPEAAVRLRAELQERFRAARRESGSSALLALRAVQTRLFLAAVRRWQAQGRADRELWELGGRFDERSRRSGWLRDDGELVFSDAELAALYRARWTELVGAARDPEFRLTLHELRLYYRALLEHPERSDGLPADVRRMTYVRVLEERDTEYPGALARGVLHYRLGQHRASAAAFMAHVAQSPEGPYALSARNYLLAALAGSAASE